MSDEPQTGVVRAIVTDTPTDSKDLKFKAWFKLEEDVEREAAVTPEVSEFGRTFKVRIGFKGSVVRQGKRVQIRFKYRMPGSVARNEDYWVFPVNYFERRVDILVVEAVFAQDPVDQGFFAVTETGLRPVNISGPVPSKVDADKPYCLYDARVESPSGFYLLRWRLE